MIFPEQNGVVVMPMPDLLENWPWPRRINPHHDEVAAESTEWTRGLGIFDDASQRAFEKCRLDLLGALFYSQLPREQLRVGYDLMMLFFAIDHYTDDRPTENVRGTIDMVLDAMDHVDKSRPPGESVVGEMARQFMKSVVVHATEQGRRHFHHAFRDYLESVVEQAEMRDAYASGGFNPESYMANRRYNIGVKPSIAIAEMHFSLSDEIAGDPQVQELEMLVTDMMVFGNDLVSYNKEQATGDDQHNIVTVLREARDFGLDDAVAWIVAAHAAAERRFLELYEQTVANLCRDDPDGHIAGYLDCIAAFPRGNDCWSFESGRYFGQRGAEVRRAGYVELWPKLGHVPLVLDVDEDIEGESSRPPI